MIKRNVATIGPSHRSLTWHALGPLRCPTDLDKEEEVQRVRLKNIHLSNQLRRIEQNLQQKEELAEGLHLIDFEQLKIENQSLNEKIEERNEELLKLRKKTTTTVQVGWPHSACQSGQPAIWMNAFTTMGRESVPSHTLCLQTSQSETG